MLPKTHGAIAFRIMRGRYCVGSECLARLQKRNWEEQMIQVSVHYPAGDTATFNWDYYLGSHMPMVKARLGAACTSVTVNKGVSSGAPGSTAPYIAVALLTLDSLESLGAAMATHGEEIMSDIPNYTNTQPVMQIGELITI
jgi:uncharacterized protein (TIGR02118 family)